jgi:acetyl-CoA/propionyl-CoA carboxylase biotin carboxyl carrier protein
MYDPMVAKLIVWDADREQATARMLRALGEYEIEGLKTLIPFHTKLLSSKDWAEASTCRELLEDKEWLKSLAFEKPPSVEEDAPEKETKTYEVEVSGKRFDVRVTGEAFAGVAVNGAGAGGHASPPKKRGERKSGGAGGPDLVESPLQGNMWKVLVKKGDAVDEGQLLCIIEAMKMENEITAPKAGVVEELHVAEGEPIAAGAPIAKIVAAAAAE